MQMNKWTDQEHYASSCQSGLTRGIKRQPFCTTSEAYRPPVTGYRNWSCRSEGQW